MSPPGPLRAELGPILAALAVTVGARAGEHLPWAAATLPGVALVVAPPLSLLLLARRRRSAARRGAGLLCLAALGVVTMARALTGLGGSPDRLAATSGDRPVTVRLAADPETRWASVRVPARLEAVGGAGERGLVLVSGTGAAAERLRLLEAGESAVLQGWFRELRAGERRWRWRHAAAVFEADDLVGAGRAAPGWGTPTGRWWRDSSWGTTATCRRRWRPISGRPGCRTCSWCRGRT
jgi:hypothetical protein